jgi:quercetin dioxygenase-like cupin family protein
MDIQIETKVVFRKHELTEIGAGAISYLQVGKNLQNNQLQMMLERYKPGADTGQNMLTHESEESGIILEGRLEVTIGDNVYYLNAGDAYLFNSTIPHRFKNPDVDRLRSHFSLYSPEFLGQLTIDYKTNLK